MTAFSFSAVFYTTDVFSPYFYSPSWKTLSFIWVCIFGTDNVFRVCLGLRGQVLIAGGLQKWLL